MSKHKILGVYSNFSLNSAKLMPANQKYKFFVSLCSVSSLLLKEECKGFMGDTCDQDQQSFIRKAENLKK